ncbi:A/G-specific adenine glycosylase [Crateriforma conspicua]|uniref:A/G-specific adenine glycosylase n=1 Tax=Crateriforma conspicua TaxID=2527996 RepID=UPI00118A226B|nr:A/G-specific adenine glycosylase [Crateriforma conspicua]QDV64160.1 A/G-specific adenine glycosylase [Crateriforma conspicua]
MTDHSSGSKSQKPENRAATKGSDEGTRRTSKGKKRSADAATPLDPQWTDAAWRSRCRKRLLDWFADNARSLPWRRDPKPYHVWVSEIMCQQTQVATVLPYFERFLRSYPTIADLAQADEGELMRQWEGLGYYRRARGLHAAAKKIVAEHDGVFPETFDEVLALPGIGRYTAGAILSIACGQRHPILEGNTQRVFSRWVALEGSPSETPNQKALWQIAEAMLPPSDRPPGRDSGAFNQAAMELGALVCKPRDPDCNVCPVSSMCAAKRLGMQSQIPGKVKKIQYEDKTEFALILSDGAGRYLMRPIPKGGRWAGLWDFPRPVESSIDTGESATRWLADQLGCSMALGSELATIRHAVTKYRIRLSVHRVRSNEATLPRPPSPWTWLSVGEMSQKPLSVTGRKIAKMLDAEE